VAVASGGIFLAQVRGTGTVLLRVSRAQTPLRASRGEPAPPARGTPATCTSLARAPAASPDSSWHGAGATRSAAAGALPGARERSRSREWLQWRLPRGQARWSGTRRAVRPPPPRTKWTRRGPHPGRIGHAASLSQCGAVRALAGAAPAQRAYYEVVHSLCVLNGNEHLHPPVARAQLGAAAAPRASRAPAMQEAAQGAAGHLRRWRAALWERPSPTQHAAPTRSRPAARAHPGFRGRAFRAPNPLKSGVSPSARWR